jgi:hypothetical protein
LQDGVIILNNLGNVVFFLSEQENVLFDATAATVDNGVYNGIPAAGFDGIINWQRFYGQMTHTDSDTGVAVVTVTNPTPNQGFHAITGIPTPNMPVSGSAHYDLIGATRPTNVTGSVTPGTVISGGLDVNFGTDGPSYGSLSGNLNIAMDSKAIDFGFGASYSGGPAFSGFGIGFGSGCIGSCSGGVEGFFAGADAARAGVAYQIGGVSIGDGSPISGAAVFTKTALPAPPPPPLPE